MLAARPNVGPYQGERLLGIGAHGAVWAARGPRGPVALKVARHPDAHQALEAEARVLRDVHHPHLVRLEQAGPGWLATELVHGVRIDRWCHDKPIRAVLDVALEAASALQALHAHGHLHGDLSPKQCLVDLWGHPKLLDAGGVTSGGTPGFVAPEVIRGAAPTVASDVYGFAATIYTCVAGRPPLPDADPIAALHRATRAVPVPPSAFCPGLPGKIDRWLRRALLRVPDTRPDLPSLIAMLQAVHLLQPERPIVGMTRARETLGRAVCEAADGARRIVVVHGVEGSGKRTLIDETLALAKWEGMEVVGRYDAPTFRDAARAGRRPAAALRWNDAAPTTDLPPEDAASLLLVHAPHPVGALTALGAWHLTPDALTLADARAIGAWLGVPDAQIGRAWRRTHGHPHALWMAFDTVATRSLKDRSPFTLHPDTATIIAALKERDQAVPVDRLAHRVGLSLPRLADHLDILVAAGLIVTEQDGWMMRLTDPEDG